MPPALAAHPQPQTRSLLILNLLHLRLNPNALNSPPTTPPPPRLRSLHWPPSSLPPVSPYPISLLSFVLSLPDPLFVTPSSSHYHPTACTLHSTSLATATPLSSLAPTPLLQRCHPHPLAPASLPILPDLRRLHKLRQPPPRSASPYPPSTPTLPPPLSPPYRPLSPRCRRAPTLALSSTLVVAPLSPPATSTTVTTVSPSLQATTSPSPRPYVHLVAEPRAALLRHRRSDPHYCSSLSSTIAIV